MRCVGTGALMGVTRSPGAPVLLLVPGVGLEPTRLSAARLKSPCGRRMGRHRTSRASPESHQSACCGRPWVTTSRRRGFAPAAARVSSRFVEPAVWPMQTGPICMPSSLKVCTCSRRCSPAAQWCVLIGQAQSSLTTCAMIPRFCPLTRPAASRRHRSPATTARRDRLAGRAEGFAPDAATRDTVP